MKVYTIIDVFDDGSECWVANYSDIGSAKIAFREYLKHNGETYPSMNDKNVYLVNISDDEFTTDELFDDLVEGGWGMECGDGSTIFVRGEDMHSKFSKSDLPF